MSKLQLKNNPTLADLQQYIREMVKERGFHKETAADNLMLLVEEVGELSKAMRKSHGVKMASDAAEQNIAEEVADIFIVLTCLCNRLGIDLEQAFRDKEEKNKQRVWK